MRLNTMGLLCVALMVGMAVLVVKGFGRKT